MENLYAAYVLDPENGVNVPIDKQKLLNERIFGSILLEVKYTSCLNFLFLAVNESYSEPKGLNKKEI